MKDSSRAPGRRSPKGEGASWQYSDRSEARATARTVRPPAADAASQRTCPPTCVPCSWPARLRETRTTVEVRSPYDDALVARVSAAGPDEYEEAARACVAAAPVVAALPLHERSRILRQVSAALRERRDVVRDMHRPGGRQAAAGRPDRSRSGSDDLRGGCRGSPAASRRRRGRAHGPRAARRRSLRPDAPRAARPDCRDLARSTSR